MLQNEIRKPLINNEDNVDGMLNLITKCKKKIDKRRKLERNTLKEINQYVLEMIDKLNYMVNYELTKQGNYIMNNNISNSLSDNLNVTKGKSYTSIQFLIVNLDSFIIYLKEKLNIQKNRLENLETVNNKLYDDDFDISETIRIHNEIANKSFTELKNVLQNIESLENLKNNLTSKGPKIQKRKFSTDEEIMGITVKNTPEEVKNRNIEYMNKWIGFFTFLLAVGSIVIMILFLWENA